MTLAPVCALREGVVVVSRSGNVNNPGVLALPYMIVPLTATFSVVLGVRGEG